MPVNPIQWKEHKLRIIDQTKLPHKLSFIWIDNLRDLRDAICTMRIRGAPALGVAAAFGVVLGVRDFETEDFDEFKKKVQQVCEFLSSSRPTAVNLCWGVNRMYQVVLNSSNLAPDELKKKLLQEACFILQEDKSCNKKIGEQGALLINHGDTVLTHCNAGALATGGYGTALSVIYQARQEGRKVNMYVDETRPLLQGARLTAWELLKEGIEVTVICDSAAGEVMREGRIDKVIVGADRVAANGDVANKIGTYSLAVLAKENKVPFYVACPVSTVDFSIPSGAKIPIELRADEEVTSICGQRCAPEGVSVYNPAFDVTPYQYVSTIITEKGICRAPYQKTLSRLYDS